MTVSEDHAEMSQVWWSRVALIVCLLELAAESLLFCPLRLVGLWTAFSGTSPRTVSLSVASSLTSSSSLVLRSAEKGVGSCYSSSHLRPAALLLWRSGLVALSAENSGKFSSFSGRITNRFKYCSNYWRDIWLRSSRPQTLQKYFELLNPEQCFIYYKKNTFIILYFIIRKKSIFSSV